jgi:UPF0271 protein
MNILRTIDLNVDIGELMVSDSIEEELMRYVTSANIACGGHAGDAKSMRRTLELAKEYGVAAGAHPGYPDRDNFGRVARDMPCSELHASLVQQIESLCGIAAQLGIGVTHVKPHGALYHDANRSQEIAGIIANVVCEIDARMVIVGQAGKKALQWYTAAGAKVAAEAFADRAYEPDGSLRDRKRPGALLNAADAALQGLHIATQQTVFVADAAVAIQADTICIHSDTPNSSQIAQQLRRQLETSGMKVRALSRE